MADHVVVPVKDVPAEKVSTENVSTENVSTENVQAKDVSDDNVRTETASDEKVSELNVFLKGFGVGSHVADVGTDFQSGILFILRGDPVWGGLTLAFAILSMLIGGALTAWVVGCTNKCLGWLTFICFPFAPLGALCWDFVVTLKKYRRGETNGTYDDDYHTGAAAMAKASEAVTEALPQCSLSTHIIFQTTYVVGGVVQWYQWLSLAVSVLSLAGGIVTNDFITRSSAFNLNTKTKKAIAFIVVLPLIASRVLLWATYGTILSGLFFLPLGIEVLILFIGCCSESLLGTAVASCVISVGSAIGGLFTVVALPVSITTLALNTACGLGLIGWAWKSG